MERGFDRYIFLCLLHLGNFFDFLGNFPRFLIPFITHTCLLHPKPPITHMPPSLFEWMGGVGRDKEYWLKLQIYPDFCIGLLVCIALCVLIYVERWLTRCNEQQWSVSYLGHMAECILIICSLNVSLFFYFLREQKLIKYDVSSSSHAHLNRIRVVFMMSEAF